MAVGSGTVEAEKHIIGSGREEQDIGEQFFSLVHLVWLEAIILVSQGNRRETSSFGVTVTICVNGGLMLGKANPMNTSLASAICVIRSTCRKPSCLRGFVDAWCRR